MYLGIKCSNVPILYTNIFFLTTAKWLCVNILQNDIKKAYWGGGAMSLCMYAPAPILSF